MTCLRFSTDRFDFSSTLPEAYNAGNRFYGKDVAEFLATSLQPMGWATRAYDEDWGWAVSGGRDEALPVEIGVYNLADHGEGGRPGTDEWGLWIRAYERSRRLGLLPRRVEVTAPPDLIEAVTAVLAREDIAVHSWADGPEA